MWELLEKAGQIKLYPEAGQIKPMELRERKSPPKGYPKDRKLYAIPETWQYPIDTEKHVRAALAYFSRYHMDFPPDVRKKAWVKIIRAAEKFKIKLRPEIYERGGLRPPKK